MKSKKNTTSSVLKIDFRKSNPNYGKLELIGGGYHKDFGVPIVHEQGKIVCPCCDGMIVVNAINDRIFVNKDHGDQRK